MSSISPSSSICIIIICIYPFIGWILESWVTSVNGYELGNRRRFVSVIKLELAMTVLNIFIYRQLLKYFDVQEDDTKAERRCHAIWRNRCSIGLILFSIFSQLIYFMYYAPPWLQWILFDISTICCGLWTNLLAFACGFWLINVLRAPFLRITCTRFLIEFVSQLNFFKNLIFQRRSQIRLEYFNSFNFLRFTIAITIILSFLMWSTCDFIRVKERTLRIPNFSGENGQLKFAVISDIHAGASVYKEQVTNVVDRLLPLDVDAVLIVGDMVDGPVKDIEDRVAPFWQLPRRFPTYFVTGNHDYYYGDVMEWVKLYQKMGIHVLNNNHTLFKGVCLAGVNDISSGKMGIKNHESNATIAVKYCPSNSTRILMAHNPATVKDIPPIDLEKIDLIFSGHTHAGQFYVVVPAVYWMLPYFYGLYDLPVGGKLMVSAGTLYQGPNMKMLGMSEIWIVTLEN